MILQSGASQYPKDRHMNYVISPRGDERIGQRSQSPTAFERRWDGFPGHSGAEGWGGGVFSGVSHKILPRSELSRSRVKGEKKRRLQEPLDEKAVSGRVAHGDEPSPLAPPPLLCTGAEVDSRGPRRLSPHRDSSHRL